MSENVGYLRFVRELASYARKPTFAFVGNESFFKLDALTNLRRYWLKAMALDEERFDGIDKDCKVHRLEESVSEYPMIGKFRLVEVSNADKVKDLKKIGPWLTDLSVDTKVIMAFTDDLKEPPPELKFACVVICNDMGVDSKEYDKYIDYCLELRKKTLTDDARAHVKTVFGEYVWLLRSELQKASFYVGDRQQITKEDLDKTLAIQAAAKIFDLIDLIIQRNLKKAMLLLNDLMAKGMEPGSLFTLLMRRLQTLENVAKAYARGEKLKDYMIRKKIPLFQYGQLMEGTRNLKPYHFKVYYNALCENEAKLKNWAEPRLVLENLLMQLCN